MDYSNNALSAIFERLVRLLKAIALPVKPSYQGELLDDIAQEAAAIWSTELGSTPIKRSVLRWHSLHCITKCQEARAFERCRDSGSGFLIDSDIP